MIELVVRRLRSVLRAYLPTEIDRIQSYWEDNNIADDLAEFTDEIIVPHPRDDAGGCSYHIGIPQKISDLPALCIVGENIDFDRKINVTKEVFQSEVQNLLIRFYFRTSLSVLPHILEMGLMRFVDATINTVRKYRRLKKPSDGTDPITVSIGTGNIFYYPRISMRKAFYKAADLNLVAKVTDSLRSRVFYGD